MPAGRNGPAFIVTPNFYVLKEYNESDLYALFIGHARRPHRLWRPQAFARTGARSAACTAPTSPPCSAALEKHGYDVGGADGLPGFKTRRSIGEWQAKNGRAATCFPDKELVRAVR